ncbi:MAG: DUF3052 domain-containing protein [Gammaproteobacteria bacterium]|nr:DUF3052 domain-containing protein [Gammaproteobacteria bacterium]
MASYSATPLVKKLGIKPGDVLYVRNSPEDYRELCGGLPPGAKMAARLAGNPSFVHLFTASRDELAAELATYREGIAQDGTIWVSWPKKASQLPGTVSEDTVREIALRLGFVDIKVCAVDDVWSGLKLVIRKELRKPE